MDSHLTNRQHQLTSQAATITAKPSHSSKVRAYIMKSPHPEWEAQPFSLWSSFDWLSQLHSEQASLRATGPMRSKFSTCSVILQLARLSHSQLHQGSRRLNFIYATESPTHVVRLPPDYITSTESTVPLLSYGSFRSPDTVTKISHTRGTVTKTDVQIGS